MECEEVRQLVLELCVLITALLRISGKLEALSLEICIHTTYKVLPTVWGQGMVSWVPETLVLVKKLYLRD